MEAKVKRFLNKCAISDEVERVDRIFGGSINESFYVQTDNGFYFLKYHEQAPEAFFESEVLGLKSLIETNTVYVPEVIAYQDGPSESFLFLEWLEGEKTNKTEYQLGELLASLHNTKENDHGLNRFSYIGSLREENGTSRSWLEFYRDGRLMRQVTLGKNLNRIQLEREKQLLRLIEHLDKWIRDDITPSPLHGDLWSGNWLVGPEGLPFVIDPSYFRGDRYVDLAFTELFGGFSEEFYNGYTSIHPLTDEYEVVKPLYQLYYLLVHLNMFGEAYGPQIDQICQRYNT